MKELNKDNFVILGGAGYVGVFLVNALIKKYPNSNITILTNNLTKSVFFRTGNVELTNKAESIKDKEIVLINLAYSLGEQFSDTKRLNDRIIGDIQLLSANNKVSRLIHVSSIVLSQHKEKWDTVEVTKRNIYYFAKSYVELKLKKLSNEVSYPVVFVRSGNIMGPGSPWVSQIIKRISDQKPILGRNKSFPSNTTFVGNLCEVIISLSVQDDIKSTVLNCCEFGDVSWNKWIEEINRKSGYNIKYWEVDSVASLKPSLKADIKYITGKLISIAIPLIYKGRYTNILVIKMMDFFKIKGMKSRMKIKVGSSSTKQGGYIDLTEYEMMSVFMNEEPFKLEGMPHNVKSGIPYSFEDSLHAIYNWMKANGIN